MNKKILNILIFMFGVLSVGVGQITVNTNFLPNIASPIDSRMVKTNLSDTSTIAFKYEGQLIFITSTNKFYYYETYWKELRNQAITIDSTSVTNLYGTIITESPTNQWNIKIDTSKIATLYDVLMKNIVDSTSVVNSYGTSITESPANQFNITVDSSKFVTTYDLTQIPDNDTQDLSLDSLNRVFTLSLVNGGNVKWKDIDTKLNETEVDNYVSNNGYLTTEVDGSTSNELQSLSMTDSTNRVFTLTLSNGNTVKFKDTNTQLSNEQVQDIVGAMTTSNTETGITVTYEDGDGTLDFVAADQSATNEIQTISIDSTNRVFTITLSSGGTIKFKDTDTNSGGTVTSIASGNGMNFTTITGTGTVTMGTPGTLTDATGNGVTTTSHTHSITTYSPSLTWNSSTQPISLTSNGKTLGAALTINIDTTSTKGMATQYDLTSKLSNTLNSANIFVGNGSNIATGVAMSGDVTITNAGATTIADNSVDGTDIALGSDAQGDVMYYDGTNWARLGAGTSGQYLKTQGASANPIWATVSAGSTYSAGYRLGLSSTTFNNVDYWKNQDTLNVADGLVLATSKKLSAITNNSANWNTAYGWGNHASAGYLTSQTSHADVVVDGDFTSQGLMKRGASSGTYSIVTDNSTDWNTAYTDRMNWNGGSTGLVAATGRTSLGGTTIGQSMFTLTNPSAITFPRFNADNTVSALSATDFRTAIGAGTGSGTVTSVSGTTPIASSGGTTPAISIANAVADGSTKGAASFTAVDFNASSGNVSIDYTNAQAASGSVKGFLTSTDWTNFDAANKTDIYQSVDLTKPDYRFKGFFTNSGTPSSYFLSGMYVGSAYVSNYGSQFGVSDNNGFYYRYLTNGTFSAWKRAVGAISPTDGAITRFNTAGDIYDSALSDDNTYVTSIRSMRINSATPIFQLLKSSSPIYIYGDEAGILGTNPGSIIHYIYGNNNYSISTDGTKRFIISGSGAITVSSLAGTGTRLSTSSSTGVFGNIANGTGLLYNNGSGAYTWVAGALPALTDGYIWVGNAANAASERLLSGDATISNMGVVTVADDSHSHTSTTLPFPFARYRASDTLQVSSVVRSIKFDTESFDPTASYSVGSYEVTVPAIGYYEVQLQGMTQYGTQDPQEIEWYITVNGSAVSNSQNLQMTHYATTRPIALTDIVYVSNASYKIGVKIKNTTNNSKYVVVKANPHLTIKKL